mmetsp:Transcript_22838/g.20743  ORF Transcript_22838/g.20743 Transcript_22838/m.20743 type:complete len:119 (+) Transcript_22838:44-400(+)
MFQFRRLINKTIHPIRSVNVRNMAGHAKADKGEQDALEKFVRKYLPENEHIALAVMGFYASLFTIYSILPKKKKIVKLDSPIVVESSSADVPSIDSPAFDKWISTDGNLEKILTGLAN